MTSVERRNKAGARPRATRRAGGFCVVGSSKGSPVVPATRFALLLPTPQNPLGVGATLRLISGAATGPAREIHAGSGYWSQDAATQVLASRNAPSAILVRWPGGALTTNVVPAGAREITVDFPSGRSSK